MGCRGARATKSTCVTAGAAWRPAAPRAAISRATACATARGVATTARPSLSACAGSITSAASTAASPRAADGLPSACSGASDVTTGGAHLPGTGSSAACRSAMLRGVFLESGPREQRALPPLPRGRAIPHGAVIPRRLLVDDQVLERRWKVATQRRGLERAHRDLHAQKAVVSREERLDRIEQTVHGVPRPARMGQRVLIVREDGALAVEINVHDADRLADEIADLQRHASRPPARRPRARRLDARRRELRPVPQRVRRNPLAPVVVVV